MSESTPLRRMLEGELMITDGRWVTAKELCKLWELPDTPAQRRIFRKEAELDIEIISSDKGYALFSQCTPEEIQHSANRLLSQGKKMMHRGIAMLRHYHRMGGTDKRVGV